MNAEINWAAMDFVPKAAREFGERKKALARQQRKSGGFVIPDGRRGEENSKKQVVTE